MKYRVLRPHDGDKFYRIGDIREGNEFDLKHLVPLTLEPITSAVPEGASADDGASEGSDYATDKPSEDGGDTASEDAGNTSEGANETPGLGEGLSANSINESVSEDVATGVSQSEDGAVDGAKNAEPVPSNKAVKAAPKNKGG